jgi:hypothetical protein
MESLVSWNKKRDKYDDEADGDFELRSPKLVDTMQDVEFIKRDETNAKAMRAMKLKWW